MAPDGTRFQSSAITPDRTEAERHLTLLDEVAEVFTFQTFTDAPRGRKPSPDPLAKVLHGSLDDCWAELVKLNQAGAGVFVTVQATDGRGRRLENITAIRAVFREADRPDCPPLPLEPHLIVATSPGHQHDYILVEGAPLDEFEGVQQRLVDDYGSDPNAKDRARVLRLAGFHQSKREPFRVHIVHESGTAPYPWAEVLEALPPVPVTARGQTAELPPPGTPLDEETRDGAKSMLLALDPDCGYSDWLRVGMCLHSTGGTLEAFEIWDAWSSGALHAEAGQPGRGTSWRPGECAAKWATFGRYSGPPVTLDTLRWLARGAGWNEADWVFRDVDFDNLPPLPSPEEQEIQTQDRIRDQLMPLIGRSPLEIDRTLSRLAQRTKTKKAALMAELKLLANAETGGSNDPGMTAAAETLRRHYEGGTHLLFHPSRTFWRYTGSIWKQTHPESIGEKVVATIQAEPARYQELDAQGMPRPPDFDKTQRKAVSLIKQTQNRDEDPFGLLEAPPPAICCENGELWLPARRLVAPHRADSYLITGISVTYNAAAECPTFSRVLKEIMGGDKDLARHMAEQLGYIVWPKKWLTTFQLWIGEGSNGKSLLTWVIQQLLGDAYAVTRIQELDGRFAKESLPGKLALFDDDLDHTEKLPISEIKKLAERKVIDTDVKYGARLRFVANLALVLLANDWPVVRDTSFGYLRRANVTPFRQTFMPQRDALNLARGKGYETLEDALRAEAFGDDFKLADETLKDTLTAELPGILNFLLDAAERLVKRGGWDEPAACVEAREQWLRSHDSVARYVHEECEHKHGASVPLEEFQRCYSTWCLATQTQPCGAREITKRLERLGLLVSKTRGRQHVRDLQIHPVVPNPPPPTW